METLKANVRDMTKKAKRLRREGFITGSICGRDMKESLSIQIPENDVLQFMKSHNVGCKMTLDVDGKSYVVMLKNVDYDSLTSHYINMDFQQLEADEKVKGTAEVILENEDRCAGFVTSNCTELEYEAYPKDIFDRIVMVFNQVIMAVPPSFSGILISWVFGMVLHLFSPGGFVSYERSFWGFVGYLVFPAIAIALPRAAQVAKLLRGSILEEAGKNYTRTAYSRGNTTSGVLYGHVLKNAFLPVLTFLGMSLANMLAGSLVVERVFGIPGISTTLLSSIGNRDYPVVLAIVMWIAVVIIVINLIVDILYRVLDPRIAEEG